MPLKNEQSRLPDILGNIPKLPVFLGILAVTAGGVVCATKQGQAPPFDNTPGIFVGEESAERNEGFFVRAVDGDKPYYEVILDPNANKKVKEGFREDPCGTVLGEYAGEISCQPGSGESVVVDKLPGEQ